MTTIIIVCVCVSTAVRDLPKKKKNNNNKKKMPGKVISSVVLNWLGNRSRGSSVSYNIIHTHGVFNIIYICVCCVHGGWLPEAPIRRGYYLPCLRYTYMAIVLLKRLYPSRGSPTETLRAVLYTSRVH